MQDEPKFMRIRTKKHELIITPGKTLSIIIFSLLFRYANQNLDDKYVLVVLQDPGQ